MTVGEHAWTVIGPDGAVHLVERRMPTWWQVLMIPAVVAAAWRVIDDGLQGGWFDPAPAVGGVVLGVRIGADLVRRWTDPARLRLDPGGRAPGSTPTAPADR